MWGMFIITVSAVSVAGYIVPPTGDRCRKKKKAEGLKKSWVYPFEWSKMLGTLGGAGSTAGLGVLECIHMMGSCTPLSLLKYSLLSPLIKPSFNFKR